MLVVKPPPRAKLPFPRGLVRAQAKAAGPRFNVTAHFYFQAVPQELTDFAGLKLGMALDVLQSDTGKDSHTMLCNPSSARTSQLQGRDLQHG